MVASRQHSHIIRVPIKVYLAKRQSHPFLRRWTDWHPVDPSRRPRVEATPINIIIKWKELEPVQFIVNCAICQHQPVPFPNTGLVMAAMPMHPCQGLHGWHRTNALLSSEWCIWQDSDSLDAIAIRHGTILQSLCFICLFLFFSIKYPIYGMLSLLLCFSSIWMTWQKAHRATHYVCLTALSHPQCLDWHCGVLGAGYDATSPVIKLMRC